MGVAVVAEVERMVEVAEAAQVAETVWEVEAVQDAETVQVAQEGPMLPRQFGPERRGLRRMTLGGVKIKSLNKRRICSRRRDAMRARQLLKVESLHSLQLARRWYIL